MKSSDQGDILVIKLFYPGRERINWQYGSDYPLYWQVRVSKYFSSIVTSYLNIASMPQPNKCLIDLNEFLAKDFFDLGKTIAQSSACFLLFYPNSLSIQ